MRKYTLLVLAVALLFAMGMMAQTGSGSSGSSSQYPSSSDQSGMQSGSQAGSSGTAASKTVEGCVVRQATDYFIYPASGQPQHVSGSGQDVSAHLGHQVKAHGTSQPSTSASSSGASGSTSASTGSSGSAGGTDFVVDKVDMIATNCPAAIQQSAQSAGMSTSPQ
jgi:hypothetical protein